MISLNHTWLATAPLCHLPSCCVISWIACSNETSGGPAAAGRSIHRPFLPPSAALSLLGFGECEMERERERRGKYKRW